MYKKTRCLLLGRVILTPSWHRLLELFRHFWDPCCKRQKLVISAAKIDCQRSGSRYSNRAIHWINFYPVEYGNIIGFPNTYPLKYSDLFGG